MRRGLIISIVLIVVTIQLVSLIIFLQISGVMLIDMHAFITSSLTMTYTTPLLSPTAVVLSKSESTGGLDSTIIAALIGLLGVVITAGVSIYLFWHNRKLEHEKILLQIEATSNRAIRDREQQLQEIEAETAQAAMLKAKNIEERVQVYRKALHADSRIARLQILDMSHPLEITNVYVQLRLHQEPRSSSSYALIPILAEAETKRDPNISIRADKTYLESRSISSLDPYEAIRIYKRCVIVGDPGAGKTTLLKHLVLKSVDRQVPGLPDFPIHIELNAFASSGSNNLLDFASTKWDERYGFPSDEARSYMERRLNEGNALLLLDALDETVIGETLEVAEASYKRVADAIMQVATRYYQSPIVVTARKAGYQQRKRLEGFTELEVLDFRTEDIRQFVNNWFANRTNMQKQSNATDLNTKLERNLRMQALAANPLLLSLIVIVYEAQLDLPDRRAELYKQCVETLLTIWDASRDIRRRREFKPEHKRQLLGEIAWYFHNQGQRYFSEHELLKVIADFLPAVNLLAEQNSRVLEEIAAENGLLKEQARSWYGFLHLTLQEFFVAQYATDHNQLAKLLEHRGDPWWEEVLLLYAGHVPDASLLLKNLMGQDTKFPLQEDIFRTNLLLAGRCLAARPILRQTTLREEITTSLFDLLMLSPYTLMKQQAAETLVGIGGAEVNMRLERVLYDEQIDLAVRNTIANAFSTSNDRSIVPNLLTLLSNKQVNPAVRQSVATTLGILGDCSIAPTLLSLLFDQQIEPFIRRSIANALGTLGDDSLTPRLLSLLTDEHIDLSTRRTIANALGELGNQFLVPSLLPLISNKQIDLVVRIGIANALGKLGNQFLVPSLLPLISNKQIDLGVRMGIVNTLGMLNDLRCIPILLSHLGDPEAEEPMRISIVNTLGSLRDRSVVTNLFPLLQDIRQDKTLRRQCAFAIGQLGDHSLVPKLLSMLEDSNIDEFIQGEIVVALGQLGASSVVPRLIYLLQNTQYKILRENIISAIGQLADQQSTIHALSELLQQPDIADKTHQALWKISRRAGVRVFMIEDPYGKHVEVFSW
jgi:HEAT repeat protein/GTPase SAR1 family protein